MEPSSATPTATDRGRKLIERGRAVLPWASFAFGLATGVVMDRRPENATVVAISACAGWFVVSGVLVVGKLITDRLKKRRALAEKLVAFSHFSGMQSITQLCIFFAFPFYLHAASLRIDHALFLLLLAGAGFVSLWDPLYQAVLERPWARAPVQAFATFAGLNCVLPILGLSNRVSLYLAAFVTVIGSPVIASFGRRLREGASRALILQLSAALVIPSLILIGASSAVPPAPLGLSEAAIGTRIEEKTLVDPTQSFAEIPPQIACFTAIRAPRGLRDQLFHVWRQDGEEVDRVPLEVVGGREAGYRTWSIKKKLGKEPRGKWACVVETATGQVLGGARARVALE
jgi:hypothetical protein